MKKTKTCSWLRAYGDLEQAHTDFNELNSRAEKGLEIRSAALVIKNEDGHPEVVEASNRHGGTGIAVGPGWACYSVCSLHRLHFRYLSARRRVGW